jgi:hypothetical protein
MEHLPAGILIPFAASRGKVNERRSILLVRRENTAAATVVDLRLTHSTIQ